MTLENTLRNDVGWSEYNYFQRNLSYLAYKIAIDHPAIRTSLYDIIQDQKVLNAQTVALNVATIDLADQGWLVPKTNYKMFTSQNGSSFIVGVVPEWYDMTWPQLRQFWTLMIEKNLEYLITSKILETRFESDAVMSDGSAIPALDKTVSIIYYIQQVLASTSKLDKYDNYITPNYVQRDGSANLNMYRKNWYIRGGDVAYPLQKEAAATSMYGKDNPPAGTLAEIKSLCRHDSTAKDLCVNAGPTSLSKIKINWYVM